MKLVNAQSLRPGAPVNTYIVPSAADAIAHSRETWGTSYSRAERKELDGGLPMVWERVGGRDGWPAGAFPEAAKNRGES